LHFFMGLGWADARFKAAFGFPEFAQGGRVGVQAARQAGEISSTQGSGLGDHRAYNGYTQ
jgi:hypothetical protein